MDGGLSHRAGTIDGGREDADQPAETDRRQVTPPDHRANRLFVTPEPTSGVRNG